MSTMLIAIAGGSCSGKTYLAKEMAKSLGEASVLIAQDSYYYDLRELSPDGTLPNFDDPRCIDFDRLYGDLLALKEGQNITPPSYDFTKHYRVETGEVVKSKPVVIVEGMLLLYSDMLRPLFDLSYYIECPTELRLKRRLERDVLERGRTRESVEEVFKRQVEPSHINFIRPSKEHANSVLCYRNLYENFDQVRDQLLTDWTSLK